MTLSKTALSERLEKGSRFVRGPKQTFAIDLLSLFRQQLEVAGIRWPAPQYKREYTRFSREILGIEPWSKQRAVLDACSEHDRVAWKSGHRVSKSTTASIVALCDYCSVADMRVVLSSGSSRQVDEILWRAIGQMHAASGRCVVCANEDPDRLRITAPCPHSAVIDGQMPQLARSGLRSGFREIWGFSSKEGGRITGIAGANLRFIFDEAASISDAIYDANEGNRAGGAWILLLGNPIKRHGHFREAFRSLAYYRITTSSEESPNITGERHIQGLATEEWIEERKREWGEDSALYRTKVKGEFADEAVGGIFSAELVAEAEERWDDTVAEGRLFIGIDPAGRNGPDESAFCLRRGMRVIAFVIFKYLDADAHLAHLLGLIDEHRLPREQPVVVLDREGSIGAEVFGVLRGYRNEHPVAAFELCGVRSSERARRQKEGYDRVRDELAANLRDWIKDGGAFPADVKLEAELAELSFSTNHRNREKLISKDELRSILGRSPDRYDALSLAVWEPLSLRDPPPPASGPTARGPAGGRRGGGSVVDPYAHYDAQGGRGGRRG
jgi:phage terminase large subunit